MATTGSYTTNSTDADVGEGSPEGTDSLGALAVFVSVLATLGVILNLILNPLMLLVLHRVNSIQQTTTIFMASLTVCDFAHGLAWAFHLPEQFIRAWPLGTFLCAASGPVQFTLRAMGIYSLFLLTVDRYIAVSHPLRYPALLTAFRAKLTVCVTWAVMITFCTGLYGIYSPKFVRPVAPHLCVWNYDWRPYVSIISVLLILVSIFVLYALMTAIAVQHTRRIAQENLESASEDGHRRSHRMNKRLGTTVIIITGTLIVTWIPCVIMSAFIVQPDRLVTADSFVFIHLADVMLLTNSWLNIVIYYIRNKELRLALHSILAGWCHRLCSCHGNST
ncbi:beta-2 adrenergic receptor-like [Patiria miniata]|uniref:G-protein coupled receptors family 1 profile domain-containing protein n=1 Tax=Patiria miniata TaxID=46514 RepID=A0A914BRB4_PATMI|nr:beta-2 adrenergic receptor-like [Patiria miniata]